MARLIQRFRTGQKIADIRPQLNQIVDAVNEDLTPRGPVGADPGFLPERSIMLEVKTLNFVANASTLTCVFPGDGANPAALEYEVTLPMTFNEASRDGVSYVYSTVNVRTADGTEIQQLTPSYIVGDLIIAYFTQHEYAWRDLNIDGRQWAKVP